MLGLRVLLVALLVLVTACTNDPQGEAEDRVAEAYFDPAPLEGETITIIGEVEEVLNGSVFRLLGDEYGERGLTIVGADVPALEPGVVTRVTGVVMENDPDAVGVELGIELTEEDLAAVGESHVVTADSVELLAPVAEAGEESLAAAAEDLGAALGREAATFAGLVVGVLGDRGPYTVFAPSDQAFAESAADLLGRPGRLESLLRYHVVEGEHRAEELADVDTLTTLEGSELDVWTADGQVLVGGVPIVRADIEVAGGVAHVIDGVLELP